MSISSKLLYKGFLARLRMSGFTCMTDSGVEIKVTAQNINVDLERGTVNNYGGTPNVFSLEFQAKYLHAIQVGTLLTTEDKVLRITTHPTELLDSLLYVAQAERIE